MKKGNIRSMRFSNEILELIEAQAGMNFTAKFEALVTKCCWEIPTKECELAELEEKIKQKKKELDELSEKARLYGYHLQQIGFQIEILKKKM